MLNAGYENTSRAFKVMGNVFEYKTEPSPDQSDTFIIALVVSMPQISIAEMSSGARLKSTTGIHQKVSM